MVRLLAVIFGIIFIFIGVAGFLPNFMANGLLFGYFEVDTMHNIVHVVTGVLAIMAATQLRRARFYFQVFGLFYAVVAIVSLAKGGDLSFVMMHMNSADNILHLVVAVVALYLGFFTTSRT